ncbi:MAG: DUF6498-containing protein [bacterium]
MYSTNKNDPAVASFNDGSVWMLLAINVIALATAIWQGWSLAELMLIYWAQSLIIGASYVLRISRLGNYSTQGFRINGRSVKPNAATKRKTAFFFCVHYGGFHAVYLMFILQDLPADILLDPGFLACTVGFAVNHAFSYRYHQNRDEQGKPNIGNLMFTPYLRILPMHLTIIFGGVTGSAGAGLLIFGALKTAADAVMHVVEHRRLGTSAPQEENIEAELDADH